MFFPIDFQRATRFVAKTPQGDRPPEFHRALRSYRSWTKRRYTCNEISKRQVGAKRLRHAKTDDVRRAWSLLGKHAAYVLGLIQSLCPIDVNIFLTRSIFLLIVQSDRVSTHSQGCNDRNRVKICEQDGR